jgi:hypothetical protein
LLLQTGKAKYQRKTYLPFLSRLEVLFESMDQKYKEAAEYYGFFCDGCEDNCCRTRFYHHSLLEYLYIDEGCTTLSQEKQIEIKNKALEVCRETEADEQKGLTVRRMCPLNFNGLCVLYHYRPMICRLHGIPHELHKSGQKITYGPGCDMFNQRCAGKNNYTFDRTPFYIEMASLENEMRQAVGFQKKLKMTIAQMIAGSHILR